LIDEEDADFGGEREIAGVERERRETKMRRQNGGRKEGRGSYI